MAKSKTNKIGSLSEGSYLENAGEKSIIPYKELKLQEIFYSHNGKISDKWELYIDVYEGIFRTYRDQANIILEIGVQNGGSLEIWAKYFHRATHIIGCDIDPKSKELQFDDNRIKVINADATSKEFIEELKLIIGDKKIDIIIDDGFHTAQDIIRSFCNLFHLLSDGGLYIIEDLYTSYWNTFNGGLFEPTSALSFFKRLVDVVNWESWSLLGRRTDVLRPFMDVYGIEISDIQLSHIHSIEFYNSLCIIRKQKPDRNKLGRRIIVGNQETITKSLKDLNGKNMNDFIFPQDIKNTLHLDPYYLVKTNTSLEQELKTLIAHLENLTSERQKLLEEIARKEEEKNILQREVETLSAEKGRLIFMLYKLTNRPNAFEKMVMKYYSKVKKLFRKWRG
ncbi:MAG: CmcI family methyltransferase [Candidatus Aenigmatarchaeota archaeon]